MNHASDLSIGLRTPYTPVPRFPRCPLSPAFHCLDVTPVHLATASLSGCHPGSSGHRFTVWMSPRFIWPPLHCLDVTPVHLASASLSGCHPGSSGHRFTVWMSPRFIWPPLHCLDVTPVHLASAPLSATRYQSGY